jgi:hypothetical protein
MTSLEKSARIGAVVDRIHAEMATGVLSCPDASIAFGAGEPLSMTARTDDAELDGEPALPFVAEAFLRHASDLVMDGRAVVRRRPGQAVPWPAWRERFMSALRSAERPTGTAPPTSDDRLDVEPMPWAVSRGVDDTADRSDLPLVPPGEPVIRAQPMDVTVDLDTWARLLGNGVITVVGPHVRGVAVVAGRTLIDAFATEGERPGRCGLAARSALVRAEKATVSAVHLEETHAAAVPALWRLPAVVRDLHSRALNLEGLLDAVAEDAVDGLVEVWSSEGDMVLVMRAGRPDLAYEADRLISADAFVSRFAGSVGTVTVRLQESVVGAATGRGLRSGEPSFRPATDGRGDDVGGLDTEGAAELLDATSPRGGLQPTPDAEEDGSRDADDGGFDPDADADVAWDRLAEEAAVDGEFLHPSEDRARYPGSSASAAAPDASEDMMGPGADTREPVGERPERHGSFSPPVVPDVDALSELRGDMTSIARKLGGQAHAVLLEIDAATSVAEMLTIPERLTSLVPHPAFRGLCDRVAAEMRSYLSAT